MKQETINLTNEDFANEIEMETPSQDTSNTQTQLKPKKESDTMNKTTKSEKTTKSTSAAEAIETLEKEVQPLITQKQYNILDFYVKECLRYVDLETSKQPTKKGKGASQEGEKTDVDLMLDQFKRLSNHLREEYIQRLEAGE